GSLGAGLRAVAAPVVTDDTASGQHVGHRVDRGSGGMRDQSTVLVIEPDTPATTPHTARRCWSGRRECVRPRRARAAVGL
ncbi:MAG TPA: hypothetical protein VE196_15095, partial [Pseudonocardiaceae bacterium]|nr:hypothetical protein [Pseudonocardiaceae bacterium]